MFKTKTDNLRDALDNFVPLNKKYENYISYFDMKNCCSFVIDDNNIDKRKLYNKIRKCGFEIISKKKLDNKKTEIIVIEW